MDSRTKSLVNNESSNQNSSMSIGWIICISIVVLAAIVVLAGVCTSGSNRD